MTSGANGPTAPANPDVAAIGPNGNFVVVWQAGFQGIFGRRFTP